MKLKVYVATHFFDLFGREGTEKIAQRIEKEFPDIDLYVPQRNDDINDKEKNDSTITDVGIYRADRNELLESQVLLAYLDGVEIDSGVAGEIGIFTGSLETLKALGVKHTPKKVIGLYTDMRRDGSGDNRMYKNLMIKGAIKEWGEIVHTVDDVVLSIKEYINTLYEHIEENNMV